MKIVPLSVRISAGDHRAEDKSGVAGWIVFSPQNKPCRRHGLELPLLTLRHISETYGHPGWRKSSWNLFYEFPASLHFFLKKQLHRDVIPVHRICPWTEFLVSSQSYAMITTVNFRTFSSSLKLIMITIISQAPPPPPITPGNH